MTTFLQQILQETISTASNRRTLYLFPNRRAGLHFKQLLAQEIEQPIWAPTVMSGADFIQAQSKPVAIADKLTLLFELYAVYQQVAQAPQPFDAFLPWGSLMLGDFDEADRYVIDGERLFQNVRDLRELEDRFRLTLEEEKAYEDFWHTFSHEPLDQWRAHFAAIWQELGRLYKAFRSHLAEKGLAYEGMAYRKLAGDTGWIDDLPYDHLYICGFNALSTSEKTIFKALQTKLGAVLFWDADTWYLDNPAHEAGHFLRENFNEGFARPTAIASPLTTLPKTIECVGIPGGHGQILAAVEQLQKWQHSPDFVPEETAIVLGDESLLFPLMYALPMQEIAINITMGYPLQFAYCHSLVSQLAQLQANKGGRSRSTFNHRLVTQILQHPLVQLTAGESSTVLLQKLQDEKILYPSVEWLQAATDPLLQLIFSPCSDTPAILAYIKQVLLLISNQLATEDGRNMPFEPSFVLQYYKVLQRIEDLLNTYGWGISKDIVYKLLQQIVGLQKLPFSGEPVRGIQVMGLLETRLLDFKRLLVLSTNEGQLPKTNHHHSYIPYGIRKAFGLPTFEQQDGLSAYHFFRLLQRTQQTVLLYNTIPGKMNEGEPSRFLKQLAFEWAPINPDILNFRQELAAIPPVFNKKTPIIIEKNDAIMRQLSGFAEGGKRYFSASSLNTYITCSLKFYFQQIADIKEPDEMVDEVDAGVLGDIFHEAMKHLYTQGKGTTVNAATLALWEKQVDELLLAQYRDKFAGNLQKPTGKNVLNYNYLRTSALAILTQEQALQPFIVKRLEEEYRSPFTWNNNGQPFTVQLKGLLDREDERSGMPTILDYKTGSLLDLKGNGVAQPEQLRKNPKKKAIVQGLVYAWLFLQKNEAEAVEVGFYHLRDLQDGPKWLSKEPLTRAGLEPFVHFLGNLLTEIYDPSIPFTQTTDHKQCGYCPYAAICERKG